MKIKIISLLILLLFSACKSFHMVNSEDDNIVRKDGKCYSRCEVRIEDPNIGTEYFVYTGDENSEDVAIEYLEIEISPKKTKWEKKKRDNCQSADPNDCLVWCLVEVPGKTKEIAIVKDTSATKNWERTMILGPDESYKSEIILIEVLCEEQVTDELLQELYTSLKDRGYGGEFFSSTKYDIDTALKDYQEDNGIQTCGLDLLSMNQLGIAIEDINWQ